MRNTRIYRAFTLLEMMAVVVIMAVMLGAVAVALGNSRPSVKVKRDGATMVAFLRNMWDQSKASGTPLVFLPNYEDGSLRYRDPRLGQEKKAKFTSDAKILAVVINDRVLNGDSRIESDYEDGDSANAVYISESRGITRIGVVFGIVTEDDSYDFLTFASINLFNGKGQLLQLEEEEYQDLLTRVSMEDPS